jgi:hypothetical protein
VSQRPLRIAFTATALLAGIAVVAASLVVPTLLLLHTDDRTLNRWSQIGQAVSPVGVFFSGIAFIGIALTLFLQRRELHNQREELSIALEDQQRSSEIALRQLHTDLIKMAIDDPELRAVWPQLAPGLQESKKDHYCNLILNLQKVAYETGTIELDELQGALVHLMASPDMYSFWEKARAARMNVTSGDEAEDLFTAAVDRAFAAVSPPRPQSLIRLLQHAIGQWSTGRRQRP